MGSAANMSDISNFLENAKRLIATGQYDFVPRRSNMQSLAKYGLTFIDAKEELLELVVGDYYKGPKQDFDRPGVVWEFKKSIDDIPFYIKLKITNDNGKDILKCLSFHEDDYA